MGSVALRLAALCGAAAAGASRALRGLAGWAAGRAIAPNSLTGISLLLALCAAAWFSGGPGGDSTRGLIAMGGWLLVMTAAGRLAAFTQRQSGAPFRSAERAARGSDDSTDWLVLPDVVWADEEPAGGAPARAGSPGEPRPAGGTAGGGRVAAWPGDETSAGVTSAGGASAGVTSAGGVSAGVTSAGGVSAGVTSAGAVSAGAASAGALAGAASVGPLADGPGSADVPDGAEAVVGARGFGWLSAVCAVAAECAIYGGMAAGGRPTALIGMWPLAVMTVISVAVTDLLGACRAAAVDAGRCRELGRGAEFRRWTGRLLCPPAGARALLAAAGLAAGGPQAALLTVLVVEVISFTSTISLLAKIALPGTWAGVSPTAESPSAASAVAATWPHVVPSPGTGPGSRLSPGGSAGTTVRAPMPRVTAIVGVTDKQGATGAVRIIAATAAEVSQAPGPARTGAAGGAGEGTLAAAAAAGAGAAARAAGPGRTGGASRTGSAGRTGGTAPSEQIAAGTAGPGGARVPAAQDVVLALRDDGRAARWAGRLVQGNLIPLPPALAGLIATAMLAALGLRGLPGFIAMTPPVVMMLAAPGSSHPHDGRFDWLVPVLLALAQYVYLGALGFALAVPGPVIFSLCALTFLWYAGITAEARGAGSGGRDTAPVSAGSGPHIGWETRLFVAGLAATFGLATFGYLGLATYLAVLIGRKVLIGYLVPREEDSR